MAIDNQIKLSLSVSLLPSSLLLQCKVASYNRWSFTQVSFLYGGPLWWVGRGFQYGNVITCHWRSEHFNNCRMNRLLSPDKSRAHTTPLPTNIISTMRNGSTKDYIDITFVCHPSPLGTLPPPRLALIWQLVHMTSFAPDNSIRSGRVY